MENNAIISVSTSRTFNGKIDFAILKAIYEYPGYFEVDEIVKCIPTLVVCGLLSSGQASRLIKKYTRTWSTEKEQVFRLIINIKSIVQPEKLSEVLIKLELSHIEERIQASISEFVRYQSTAEFPNSAFIREIFYKYKSWCDDNVFESRSISLRKVFEAYLNRVHNAPTIREHDKWGDALTIVMSLLIQQHLQDDEIEHLINEFTVSWPANVNRTLPSILGHCKLAIIAALRSDWASAKMRIDQAIHSSQMYNDLAVRYMVYHAHIYICQLKLKQNNSTENQLQALVVCDRCIDMNICDVPDDFSTLAFRSFCLYKVFILLQVGPYFEIPENDVNRSISPDDIRIAEQMLDRIVVSFNSPYPVEDRRWMMFYVLKARMYQLKGRYSDALVNVDFAQAFMNLGTPYQGREESNLNKFRESLQNMEPIIYSRQASAEMN